ncbi:glycerol-3-phosphate acyltransferase [Candidatus Dependentiae bacterium]
MFSIFLFIFSYLVGSIPSGYWFAKLFFNIDITKQGSKNIGATNVARVFGSKKYFLLIFFIDFLKSFLCLYLINFFIYKTDLFLFYFSQNDFLILNAVFLLIGNSYSIFLKLGGGKGVSTALGILAFLFSVKFFLFFLLCWGTIIFITKYVSVASLLSVYIFAFTYIFLNFYGGLYSYGLQVRFIFLIFLCIWITYRHKQNIKNLKIFL